MMKKYLAVAVLCLTPVSAYAGQSVDACHRKCAHYLNLDSKSQSKSQYSFCRQGCKTSEDNTAIDLRKVPASVGAGFAKALDGGTTSASASKKGPVTCPKTGPKPDGCWTVSGGN